MRVAPPCELPGVAKRRLLLAGDVKCFGDDCYALAFGVPAALMVVALGKDFIQVFQKRQGGNSTIYRTA